MTESDGVALDCIAHPNTAPRKSWMKRVQEWVRGERFSKDAIEDLIPELRKERNSKPLNVKPLP